MKTLKQFMGQYCIVIIILQLSGFTNNVAQPRLGDWTVPTGFGQFVITVGCSGTCITDIIYTWSNFHCDGITLVSGSIHSMRTGGWAITDRSFSITTSLGTNQTITINGTFNQPGTEVSGTYSANIYGTICPGAWGPITSSIYNNENNTPTNYFLFQNYPNPFNPTTKIKFGLHDNAFTKLKVYDIFGREVSTLVNEELNAGYYEFEFNARYLSSGIYFYKIQAKDFTSVKKFVLIK